VVLETCGIWNHGDAKPSIVFVIVGILVEDIGHSSLRILKLES